MKALPAACIVVLILTAAPAHAIVFPRCSGPAVTSVAGTDVGGPDAADVKLLSAILLENEADEGRVAYCLSDAQMTNNRNGLSFGFNQYDLATNGKAKGVLVGLLKTARAADSLLALTEADVTSIDAGRFSPTAHELKSSTDQGLVRLMQRVNAALGSLPRRRPSIPTMWPGSRLRSRTSKLALVWWITPSGQRQISRVHF